MAGSWSNTLTTSLTLPTGATDPTPRIVEDGITDTILIYGPGGALIASVAATAGTDGLGNSYPAGISASAGVISDSIILLYDGTPAANNLIASAANAPGSDSFGNGYLQGFCVYDTQHNTGTIGYARLSNQALLIGAVTNGVFQNEQDCASFSGNTSETNWVSSKDPGAPVATADQAWARMFSGANGATTGSASAPHMDLSEFQDTSATDFRLSGSVIKLALDGFTPETWQVPTLSANYNLTGTGGLTTIRYRLTENNRVRVYGAFNVATAGTTALFTAAVPAAYRPALQGYLQGGNATTSASILFRMSTAGVLTPVGSIATGIWWINAEYELGQLP